ncbi:MAG: molybdopterin molybdotransferase MoeA [Anaerolineaceae bacterium]|nr:molybdopterin molybdotransferase MoeA [Anaerolineaceae bacterium]
MAAASEFFNVQPVTVALETVFAHWSPSRRTIGLDVRQGLGRVLAQPVHSPENLPAFTRSTMDGYAVIAADTFGASASLPAYLQVVGVVKMGTASSVEVMTGQAVEIHTGGMLPPGVDAVVMVERTQPLGAGEIEVLAPVAPGENLVQIGEDVRQGDLILPTGHRLRPQDIGGLLGVGVVQVEVIEPLRVGILSCGDELVTPESGIEPGQIRDINAYTLAGLLAEAGAEPVLLGIARDDLADFTAKARAGFAEVDMLIVTAGSSVSARDLTAEVISGLGQPGVLQHGLAVKPGKPTILAVCENRPVIGLPGNPVSAMLVARQIVLPLVRHWFGLSFRPAMVQAVLGRNIASTTGREDSVPVRLLEQDGVLTAEPIFGKSNLIYTLVNADGLVTVPLNSGGLKAGAAVDVVLF